MGWQAGAAWRAALHPVSAVTTLTEPATGVHLRFVGPATTTNRWLGSGIIFW
jgi:hypothetical protein